MKTALLFLGQITGPDVPWSVTSKWLFGLLGFLGAVWLVFAVIIQARKLFGRMPPLNDELEKRDHRLRGEILHAKNSALKAAREKCEELETRIEKQDELYREMQLDRERKWNSLQKELHELSGTLSYIRGKLDEQERRGK